MSEKFGHFIDSVVPIKDQTPSGRDRPAFAPRSRSCPKARPEWLSGLIISIGLIMIRAMEACLLVSERGDARSRGRAVEEISISRWTLEWLLRSKPRWHEIAEGVLFTTGDIVKEGEKAEEKAG